MNTASNKHEAKFFINFNIEKTNQSYNFKIENYLSCIYLSKFTNLQLPFFKVES